MSRRVVVALATVLAVTGCGESVEDRVVAEYQRCAAEYGFEAGVIGLNRGPDGELAITTPDLPEPGATECLRRVTAIIGGE